MTELLTAQQMRNLEAAAIESGDQSGIELMERAGRGVVGAMFEKWAVLSKTPKRALILCGPGNNGGDGFVIARLLAAHGHAIDLFLFGDPAKLPPDAQANHNRWAELGETRAWDSQVIQALPDPEIMIDAVFGIGLTRRLPDEIAKTLAGFAIRARAETSVPYKVAVDCPSGLNLDTGQYLGGQTCSAPRSDALNMADLTVTFHTPKPGHFLGQGPEVCGDLKTVDIGLRGDALERSRIGSPPDQERARLVSGQHFGPDGLKDVPTAIWPLGVVPKTKSGSHKYEYGHAVVLSGGVGRGGAGRLAARAALRIGAGLVTLICPKSALLENAIHLDAIMVRGLDDPEALSDVADDRVTGFCLGPGLGVGARTCSMVKQVLAREASGRAKDRPAVVLDADALTSFKQEPQALFDLVHARTVLTPHGGEFAGLFPDLADALQAGASKIEITRKAAARAGCIVLLKGHDTVIAASDGSVSLHSANYARAVPWLATAGAGDVLAGLITGIAAAPQSTDLFSAVEGAVWLHVQAALSFGPGLIAEDLPETLPVVLRDIGA